MADVCAGSLPAHGPAVQIPASSTTSQRTTAAERTKQSHHEKPQSVAMYSTAGADCSSLFIRTYIIYQSLRVTCSVTADRTLHVL